MVAHNGQATLPGTERRYGPRRVAHGRRSIDESDTVSQQELLALVQALERSMSARMDQLEKRADRAEAERRSERKRNDRILIGTGAVLMLMFLLSWLGPDRIAGLFGGP